MFLENIWTKNQLKRTAAYSSVMKDLETFKRLGISEYTYMGDCCPACRALNKKSFRVDEAEVGKNLPPMNLHCTCTIVAKPKNDLFKERNGENPLKNNPKFEEWKKKQQNNHI